MSLSKKTKPRSPMTKAKSIQEIKDEVAKSYLGIGWEELPNDKCRIDIMDDVINRYASQFQSPIVLPSEGKMDIIKAKNTIANYYGFDSWVDLYRTITDRGEGLYYEVEAYRLLVNNLERGNGA